jgi:hypothetical protein
MILRDRPATRLATRLAFPIAGFGIASWPPSWRVLIFGRCVAVENPH